MLRAIVAHTQDRVIGLNDQLPWHIPIDLRSFKELTYDQFIVVGRKTFDSLPLLPGRCIFILGKDRCTLEGILDLNDRGKDFWIAGGQATYETFMPYIDEVYATEILKHFDGDRYFPELPKYFHLAERSKLLRDGECNFYKKRYVAGA